MGFQPLTPQQIARGRDGAVAKAHGFDLESPLWYYILKEAQVQGRGKRLGQVGSRIIAEVMIGLLRADSSSFFRPRPGLVAHVAFGRSRSLHHGRPPPVRR
jgi:hypothetical protein